MYPTEAIAEEALISAWITYNYPRGNGPIGVYTCEDCGAYHLTSKGTMNKKLAEYLGTGEIQRNKDANAWLARMKQKGRR